MMAAAARLPRLDTRFISWQTADEENTTSNRFSVIVATRHHSRDLKKRNKIGASPTVQLQLPTNAANTSSQTTVCKGLGCMGSIHASSHKLLQFRKRFKFRSAEMNVNSRHSRRKKEGVQLAAGLPAESITVFRSRVELIIVIIHVPSGPPP